MSTTTNTPTTTSIPTETKAVQTAATAAEDSRLATGTATTATTRTARPKTSTSSQRTIPPTQQSSANYPDKPQQLTAASGQSSSRVSSTPDRQGTTHWHRHWARTMLCFSGSARRHTLNTRMITRMVGCRIPSLQDCHTPTLCP